MAQDNQKRDRQDDNMTREGRAPQPSDAQPDRDESFRPDQPGDIDEVEETDGDRDDDDRPEGGQNRRRSIS